MAGYIRQSSFIDGDTITAALFNNEYNQLVNAFSNTSGHKHDGTTAEGPVIGLIGDAGETSPNNKVLIDTTNNYIEFYVEVSSAPVQQLYIADGAIIPVTDNDIDLGTSSLEFKDIYIDGTATIDTLTVDEAATIGTTLGVTGATTLSSTLAVTGTSTLTGNVTTTNDLAVGGNLTVTGNATISGNLTFGDADTDTITIGADVASHITPDVDDTYDLGSSTKEWRNLYIDGTANIDSLVADTADINGGTIDGATIATSDITVGSGKTLDVSSGTLTLADDQISGDKVEGGTIAATTVTTLTSTTGNITNVNATTVDSTNLEVTNLKAKDGTSAGSIADSTGVVTLASSVLTTTDINGGTIDGATIATSDITVGTGKTLDVSSGTLTLADNQISGDKVEGGTIAATTITALTYGSLSDGTITITAFADEDDMSSDSATLVPTQQSVKAYVDSQVTAQDLDFQGDSGGALSIDLDSETLTIAGGTGIDTTGATNTLTVAIDSTVATLTGTQTLTNKTLTTPVISSISNTGTLTLPTSTDTLVGRATTDTLTNKTLTSPVLNTGVSGTAILDEDNMASDSATQLATQQSIKAYVDAEVGAIVTDVVSDTTPQLGGDLASNGNDILFADNDKAIFGTGSDLQIYSDGDSSFINEKSTTGSLFIEGDNIRFRTTDTTGTYALFTNGGSARLYHNNSIKFETTSTGIDVTGEIVGDGLDITDSASDIAFLRSSNATTSNVYITNTNATTGNTANLYLAPANNVAGSLISSIAIEDFSVSDNRTADLAFSTRNNGTMSERLRIDSTGNVGIGTTSPQKALDIAGASSGGGAVMRLSGTGEASEGDVTGAIQFYSADTTDNTPGVFGMIRGIAGASGGEGSLQILTDMPSEGADASNVTMHFNANGNVGIGTISPSYKTDIQNSGDNILQTTGVVSGGVTALNLRQSRGSLASPTNSSTNGDGNYIVSQIYRDAGYNSNAWIGLVTDSATDSGRIIFGTASSGTVAEKMRIDSSGQVGIGTSSPSSEFHVKGDATTLARIEPNDSSGKATLLLSSTSVGDGGIQYDSNSNLMHLFSYNYMTFNVGTGNISGGYPSNERMRIDSSGNVGIGTTSVFDSNTRLELKKSGNCQFFISSSDASGVRMAASAFGTSYGKIGTYSNHPFRFDTNDTERMRIDSSGNVLVGTTTSEGTLTVEGDASAGQFTALALKQYAVSHDQGSSMTCDMDFYLWDNNTTISTPQARIGVIGDATADQNYEAGGQLCFYTNIRSNTSPSLTERMRIDADGKVLINNTDSSPRGYLNLKGAVANNVTTILSFDDMGIRGTGTAQAIDFVMGRTGFISEDACASLRGVCEGESSTSVSHNIGFEFHTGQGTTQKMHMRLRSSANLTQFQTNEVPTYGNPPVNGAIVMGPTTATGLINGGLTSATALYNKSGELYATDSSLNNTQLTPHNWTLISDGPSEELAWTYWSQRPSPDNKEITQSINVDMAKVVRKVEDLVGEKLIYTENSNMDDHTHQNIIADIQSTLADLTTRIEALEG